MEYKKFGDTGIVVSVLGLGTMRLPGYREDNKYIDQVKAKKLSINQRIKQILKSLMLQILLQVFALISLTRVSRL